MAEYLDFGSSSEEDEDGQFNTGALDSDEEERYENAKILKMLSINAAESTKSNQKVLDFEAEMEAELDRRAFAVESIGGMEHQKSLSRSSSTSSLLNIPPSSTTTSSRMLMDQVPGPSCLKRPSSDKPIQPDSKKGVKFTEELSNNSSNNNSTTNIPTPEEDTSKNGETNDEFYDKVYFDSDESEGEDDIVKQSKKTKRKLLSNDDLFYDPNSDAEDQAWVDKQRRKYINNKVSKQNKKQGSTSGSSDTPTKPSTVEAETPLPTSDAVLNCPACFTMLCMDCQRHEFYSGQYRAMFVMNCKIDRSETLTVPLKTGKSRGKKSKVSNSSQHVLENISSNPGDIFFPVRCTICNSQVAVYDNEEIYHFFNCLASHP